MFSLKRHRRNKGSTGFLAKRNKNVRPTINKQAKFQRPHVELVHIESSRSDSSRSCELVHEAFIQ